MNILNWAFGDKQIVSRMGFKKANAREQVEKGLHFKNTSDFLTPSWWNRERFQLPRMYTERERERKKSDLSFLDHTIWCQP